MNLSAIVQGGLAVFLWIESNPARVAAAFGAVQNAVHEVASLVNAVRAELNPPA